jgi:hypothetical protein
MAAPIGLGEDARWRGRGGRGWGVPNAGGRGAPPGPRPIPIDPQLRQELNNNIQQRFIKSMPAEWDDPTASFSMPHEKYMFDFNPQENTDIYGRLNYLTKEVDAGVKREFFSLMNNYISPPPGSPTVQGIRIQQANMQHIKEFFANFR